MTGTARRERTDEQPETTPDTIDEGRRLVRAGGDRGRSLADWLGEVANRLTWRTPLHGLRLNGRYPLKLIAVPEDMILGDIARGRDLLDGVLSFREERHSIETLDLRRPVFSRGYADHLHGFAWLRDLSSVATRVQGAPIAEMLTAKWLDAHGERGDPVSWRPDLWGRRVLFWTAHAPLILSSTDLVYRSAVLNALARGARHLDRGADRTPPGAARIASWCGVVAAGLLVPGGEPRRAFGEEGLRRALGVSVFEDGGSVSRSPAMLLDSIMLLTMLDGVYRSCDIDLPDWVAATLTKMVAALLGVTHGDQGLASWQGSIPATADMLAAVIDASDVRARPLRQSRDWGYQRLAAGNSVLLVDAAPPPAGRLIDGGCASTLAFEFSSGPTRIVVNCGGGSAAIAQLPAPMVAALRSTAAHSTLVVADSNSTAINPDGTLGRGVGEVELSRQENDAASRIEASHDGYVRRWGFVHRRQLLLTGEGREVRGEDALLPEGRRRRQAMTPFAIRFHLGKGIQASPTADGLAAILRLPGGALWQFRCRGGSLGIEDSVWIDADGMPIPTHQIVVSGTAAAGGANISWALKRAL